MRRRGWCCGVRGERIVGEGVRVDRRDVYLCIADDATAFDAYMSIDTFD